MYLLSVLTCDGSVLGGLLFREVTFWVGGMAGQAESDGGSGNRLETYSFSYKSSCSICVLMPCLVTSQSVFGHLIYMSVKKRKFLAQEDGSADKGTRCQA